MRRSILLARALAAGLAAAALAACSLTPGAVVPTPTAAPTPVPATATPPPAPTPLPATATPVPQPTVAVSPQGGAPGTRVTLAGAGFTPGAQVTVRLGLPDPVGEALAGAVADATGRWQAEVIIPDTLPSGEVISTPTMALVAMDDQNVTLASAPFAFEPAPAAPPRALARTTVEQFLSAYFGGGDARVYLAGPLAAEVDAGRPIHQIVGSQPGYQGFTVRDPDDRPAEVLFVRADVTYATEVVEHSFELAAELGEWKIVGVSVTSRVPAGGAPWQSALSGDLTGDGTTEQVNYRPAQIQLPPVGFSDTSIVSLLIATDVEVRMEASPGGRELLRLSPAGLTAEGLTLLTFDAPPAGFLVVVYGGELHSFRITPLRADGQPQGSQAYEVVWSQAEAGYRLR